MRRALILGGSLALILAILSFALHFIFAPREVIYGATFSTRYARDLGIDPKNAYKAMLEDLQIRHIRIPVYWSDVESSKDQFDFTEIDWLMDQAAKSDAKVTLAIGIKVPRWPECYIPGWLKDQNSTIVEQELQDYLSTIVTRYRLHPALERWQVENEPYFPFGVCNKPSMGRVKNEIQTVRSLDSDHQIQLTSSGEQSFWVLNALPADVLGVSVYQRAWSKFTGFSIITTTPMMYALQYRFAKPFVKEIVVSELQAEPWPPGNWNRTDVSQLEKFYELFDSQDLKNNVAITERIGVSEVYFWGVEWWYYLKSHGDDRLWQAAKEIIAQ